MTNDALTCKEIRADAELEMVLAKKRMKEAIEHGCKDEVKLMELKTTVSVWDRAVRPIDARCEQNWITKHR